MAYIDCLKKQLYTYVMGFIATACAYFVALLFDFRAPHELTTEFMIMFSVTFIFFGAFFRYMKKDLDC